MIQKIKNTGLLLLGGISALLLVSSCKDDAQPEPNNFAYISLTHAGVITPTTKPVHVFVDGSRVNLFSAITYPNTVTGTYVGIQAGARAISIRDTSSAAVIEYATANLTAEAGVTYSAFVYDTLVSGKLKTLVLTTNRANDLAAGKARFRFLHLSPNAPAVDVWAFKSATDSVRIYQGVTYVGATPNASALSGFNEITSSAYTIRVRLAGTNTNVLSSNVTFAPGKAYTTFARGLVGASGTNALNISTITHN